MSMQSVLGVVGGVVGSFFGYPQLGFVVGSLVGGLLTPKEKTEGPRLDDLKVQVSTYGAGIPILYGTERIGGNVVWSTDKIEFATTQGSGKGGGAESTTYTYFVQMRVALCETPRDGSEVQLLQVFRDGKLQWDFRSGIPVASALATEENLFAFFTMYQGHADQLPDPVEEVYQGGPGSVPAYRGMVCISMKGIDCPGGRVPQFSFVLSTNATSAVEKREIIAAPTDLEPLQFMGGIPNGEGAVHFIADTVTYAADPKRVRTWSIGQDYIQPNTVSVYPDTHPSDPITVVGGEPSFVVFELPNYPVEEVMSLYRIDAISGDRVHLWDFVEDGETIYGYRWAAFDDVTGRFAVVPRNGSPSTNIVFDGNLVPGPPAGMGPLTFHLGEMYTLSIDGTTVSHLVGGTWEETAVPVPFYGGDLSSLVALITSNQNGLFVLVLAPDGIGGIWQLVNGAYVLLCDDVGPRQGDGSDAYPNANYLNYRAFYSNTRSAVLGPNLLLDTGEYSYTLVRFNVVTTDEVLVSDIIEDQLQRAGETRYDISTIGADTIHGYKIQNPASARANIDPLFTAFAIYAVEEDGLIRFKKYEDIVSVATVSYDELGQAEDGSETPDPMPLNRTQEIDLPRSVSVSYVEEMFDYQTATETAVRQVTEASEDLLIELPIATNSDRARTTAELIMYARWRQQNTRSLKVSRKFAFVSPGDGVTIEYPRGTYRLWRVMNSTDTGVMCEWSVEPGDAELYLQTAVGATDYVRQDVVPLPPPTRAQILDIPILRDQDDNAGLYVAMDSYAARPANAELFVGNDDSNLATSGTVSQSAPIGFAESIIGAASPWLVDESSVLTVNLGDDMFESVTRDVLLSGGGEYWAYGAPGRWEIGASATGTALGDGRYALTRHLRGQFGTERFTGTHGEGDIFVLLRPVGMLRPNMSAGEIGTTKSYRAVTAGRSLQSVSSQRYANTGQGVMPLSPINLRREQSADSITLSWDRRSRLAMNNLYGTLPLGEASERYLVEIYTSSAYTTLAGSFTTTSPELALIAAQQAAMGFWPSSTLYVRVYQLSDVVGLGVALEDDTSPPSSQYYQDTALLVHADDVATPTTILDYGPSHLSAQLFGNARVSAAQSKFGGGSMVFDGSGDCVLFPASTPLNLTTDFTISLWLFPNSSAAISQVVLCRAGGFNFASYEIVWDGTSVYFAGSSNNAGYDIGGEFTSGGLLGTATVGAWNHIEVTWDGNVYRGFINGSLVWSETNSLTPYTPLYGLALGANFSGGTWGESTPTASLDGFIDEVEILNGVALHTASFTPPTGPSPNY
ncbi:phage tail protein [Variovorax sp. JS1663]|uniref:phage tail protein n=1 Tax=Variovorax sp. JS1663 TaxID=1851577 RepID=UPI000B3446E0|nr:phage tail protein [Variovorax sp. JS1663]OUL98538.1 hypothetical protein A8M77_30930 [Variovorax sp. JS1663]